MSTGHPSRDAHLSVGLIALSLMALVAYLWFGLGALEPRTLEGPRTRRARPPATAGTRFEEISAQVGVSLRHDSEGVRDLRDVIAPGVGLLDLDQDGDLDLVGIAGTAGTPGIHVFANRRIEHRELSFEDVTEATGIVWTGSGQGICAGDYDADGDVDLFITALGPNLLLENRFVPEGVLRFHDATAESGIRDWQYVKTTLVDGRMRWVALLYGSQPATRAVPEFSTGASWGDFDLDGDLDLFVANYVGFDDHAVPDAATAAERDDPIEYQPGPHFAQLDRLFRNQNGRFEDCSTDLHINDIQGRSLDAVILDIDQVSDRNTMGWPEIVVGNDASQSLVYKFVPVQKQSARRFVECIQAVHMGDLQSARGIAHGDADGDGDLDLLFTQWRQPPALMLMSREVEVPRLLFRDASEESGLSRGALSTIGWGATFFDMDNDGDEDLLVGNGGSSPGEGASGCCAPQPLSLFQNLGGRFEEVSASAGIPFADSYNARGAVSGDIDLDGDLDLVVSQNNGPLLVLLNRLDKPEHQVIPSIFPAARAAKEWDHQRADLIGIVWRLECGGRTLLREFRSGGSYLSQGPFQTVAGLATRNAADVVEFLHPDGRKAPLEQEVR